MADAIGPSYPLTPSQAASTTANVPLIAKQMQVQVLTMAENLQKILDDPSLSEQPSFLKKIADDTAHLNQAVEQAVKLR